MHYAVSGPFLGSRRSVKREPLRTPTWMLCRFSHSVAPNLLAPAYPLPACFSRLGGVWPQPLAVQRKQRRPSSQCSRPCSAAPIARSTPPRWVLELFAHVMHESMPLATLGKTSTRSRQWVPTQNGPGVTGRKPLLRRKKRLWPQRCGNLSTREFALRDDRYVAAKARGSQRCPTECLATAHDSKLGAE